MLLLINVLVIWLRDLDKPQAVGKLYPERETLEKGAGCQVREMLRGRILAAMRLEIFLADL
jgi:hypothetical protein